MVFPEEVGKRGNETWVTKQQIATFNKGFGEKRKGGKLYVFPAIISGHTGNINKKTAGRVWLGPSPLKDALSAHNIK